MRPSLRAGLELPVLPITGGGPSVIGALLDGVRAAAAAVPAAGLDAVWLADGAPTPEGWRLADPFVLAASLADAAAPAAVGVVATVEGGRSPAMVARDLTALDHVSGGRSALLLRACRRGAAASADQVDALVDAATICRAMLVHGTADHRGRTFQVAGAANRPPPLQPGGPPLAVELPASLVEGDGWPALVAAVASLADAVCVGGDPIWLGRVRSMLPPGASPGPAAMVWIGALPSREGEARQLVDRLRSVGADGVLWSAGPDQPTPDEVAAGAAVLNGLAGRPAA